MKLTILGATGSVGQELVNQALAAGHSVTVLVRNPDKLGDLRSRVTVVQGDVTNEAAIKQATTGSDAVLSTLGHAKDSPDDVLATAATNITTAMKQTNVKRLVVLANITLPEAGDQPTLGQRLQIKLMGMMLGKVNSDHAAQAQILAGSGLDWTIVRAATLADGPRTGKYRTGKLDSNAGSKIARADVADFMLVSAANGKYVHSTPVLSQ